nr:hypothetical protein [Limosilactobacillus mucosae]
MNFNQAVCVEYSLNLFEEYLIAKKNGEHIPKYSIVWKSPFGLITGKTFTTNELFTPVKTSVDSELEILYIDENGNSFPANVRFPWLDRFDKEWSSLIPLYQKPAMLLKEIVNFVESLDDIKNPFEPQLIDVNFVDSGKKLPFLILESNTELTPVSLIEASEN